MINFILLLKLFKMCNVKKLCVIYICIKYLKKRVIIILLIIYIVALNYLNLNIKFTLKTNITKYFRFFKIFFIINGLKERARCRNIKKKILFASIFCCYIYIYI
jgi:hypothetical protein